MNKTQSRVLWEIKINDCLKKKKFANGVRKPQTETK